MKLNKSEFKSLVKECLVEILNEGLGGYSGIFQKNNKQVNQPMFSENIRRPPLQQDTSQNSASQIKNFIKKEAGGNKLMESILEDTALSTLPQMLQSDGGKMPISSAPGGHYERIVASSQPEELFGESASKWANLAFMNTKK